MHLGFLMFCILVVNLNATGQMEIYKVKVGVSCICNNDVRTVHLYF